MSGLYWAQVVIAAILAANVVVWARMALRYEGLARVIAVPPLTWSLHSLIFFLLLFWLRFQAGGHLPANQAEAVNVWSTAVRLHGALACLSLYYFIHGWRRNGSG